MDCIAAATTHTGPSRSRSISVATLGSTVPSRWRRLLEYWFTSPKLCRPALDSGAPWKYYPLFVIYAYRLLSINFGR